MQWTYMGIELAEDSLDLWDLVQKRIFLLKLSKALAAAMSAKLNASNIERIKGD